MKEGTRSLDQDLCRIFDKTKLANSFSMMLLKSICTFYVQTGMVQVQT